MIASKMRILSSSAVVYEIEILKTPSLALMIVPMNRHTQDTKVSLRLDALNSKVTRFSRKCFAELPESSCDQDLINYLDLSARHLR